MKILSKKKWNELQDLVVGLQQDLGYTKDQLKKSENQVEYLLGELNKYKVTTKTEKKVRKPRKEKEDGTKRKNVQEK